jgi:hypothetical protein
MNPAHADRGVASLRRWAAVLTACVGTLLPAQSIITLDTFNAGSAVGSVQPGTSWVGNLTPGPTAITVGGTATDENGWGATQQTINGTGMNYIVISAQRDSGNLAPLLAIQFEDQSLTTKVYSVSTSLFAVGQLTEVQIAVADWAGGIDYTRLTSWSLGGGTVGTVAFRMTFNHLSLSATAIPEAGTYAALVAAAAFGAAVYGRRRTRLRPRASGNTAQPGTL